MKKVNKEREGQIVQEVETGKGRKRGKIEDAKESKTVPAKKPKISNDTATTKLGPKKAVQPKVNAPEPASKPVVIPKPVTDPSRHANTVFLSNLAYETCEEDVRKMMSSSGTITDIRLVLDYKQRCKGFCYVEFSSQVSLTNKFALLGYFNHFKLS
jgi:hypothetical protein